MLRDYELLEKKVADGENYKLSINSNECGGWEIIVDRGDVTMVIMPNLSFDDLSIFSDNINNAISRIIK